MSQSKNYSKSKVLTQFKFATVTDLFLPNQKFYNEKINTSIDFLRHADETRFSNFPCDILQMLRHFLTSTSPVTRLIPKVIWTFLHIWPKIILFRVVGLAGMNFQKKKCHTQKN